jgi:hypothetical protein
MVSFQIVDTSMVDKSWTLANGQGQLWDPSAKAFAADPAAPFQTFTHPTSRYLQDVYVASNADIPPPSAPGDYTVYLHALAGGPAIDAFRLGRGESVGPSNITFVNMMG